MNGQIISIPNLQILVKSSHFMLPPVSVGQGMEEAEAGWGREAAVLPGAEAVPCPEAAAQPLLRCKAEAWRHPSLPL